MQNSSQSSLRHAGPAASLPCKGCWLAGSVLQQFGVRSISGLLCTWVDAVRDGQGRKHGLKRGIKRQAEKEKEKRKQAKTKQEKFSLRYYTGVGWDCWIPNNFTPLSWRDVTEQMFFILTRDFVLRLMPAGYTQVFKILTHNPERKAFRSQKRLH